MGKPRMIILIRHAQSEGNINREVHQTVPDHRVKLTAEGWTQAYDAGRRLREQLDPNDTLHFFTSPYRRTRETTEGILSTLTSDDPSPSPFSRQSIKVYEEPRLREQDFGNFQPCSAEVERIWQERADYGHFFYRIPNGESAADAYDRVSGFNESLWRQFGEDNFASVCILVTHGLMSRIFLMKWYHFSVEYFEDLRNVNHCEFLIMRRDEDNGKYILENRLRTWSELRRERNSAAIAPTENSTTGVTAAMLAPKSEREKETKVSILKNNDENKRNSEKVPFRQTWGGCPNGCDHGNPHRKRGSSTHSYGRQTFKSGLEMKRNNRPSHSLKSSDEDEDDVRGQPDNFKGGLCNEGEYDVCNGVQNICLDVITSSPNGGKNPRSCITKATNHNDKSQVDEIDNHCPNDDATNICLSPAGSHDSSVDENDNKRDKIRTRLINLQLIS
ncbi:Broad-range acid phosphatase DET1 [Golovinomyces cichoracearum]|uniref:Broad-range acid phosphatase DET1 n=1 Tax=Golovinomyces cichoracearum TaxID=62708 RepID=A0A420IMK0_9PEZI|nr:Broad-range acid phosphatase DET1 [Golovinomyces cichoracearum]